MFAIMKILLRIPMMKTIFLYPTLVDFMQLVDPNLGLSVSSQTPFVFFSSI